MSSPPADCFALAPEGLRRDARPAESKTKDVMTCGRRSPVDNAGNL